MATSSGPNHYYNRWCPRNGPHRATSAPCAHRIGANEATDRPPVRKHREIDPLKIRPLPLRSEASRSDRGLPAESRSVDRLPGTVSILLSPTAPKQNNRFRFGSNLVVESWAEAGVAGQ